MYPKELEKTLSEFINEGLPLLIVGAPGIGKSDIVEAACIESGVDLIVSHPVVSDPTDYKGMPWVSDKNEANFIPFGELKQLMEVKEKTVFFIDDLGQASLSVQAALMQLILARQINGHPISNNVIFIAATNDISDKAGVSTILEPVKSRFASIVKLESRPQDWLEWAELNKLNQNLISFIRFRPKMLHKFVPSRQLKNSPCPRTVAGVSRLLDMGLNKKITNELIKGACGESFAMEFGEYLKSIAALPTIDKILEDPKKIPIPENGSAQFALCDMLSYFINKENVKSIVTFGKRLNKETSVMLIKRCTEKNPKIKQNSEFQKFMKKYKEIVL